MGNLKNEIPYSIKLPVHLKYRCLNCHRIVNISPETEKCPNCKSVLDIFVQFHLPQISLRSIRPKIKIRRRVLNLSEIIGICKLLKFNDILTSDIINTGNTNRKPNEVKKRQIVIRLLRNEYDLSFSVIGQLIKRHHSSVIHLYYKSDY